MPCYKEPRTWSGSQQMQNLQCQAGALLQEASVATADTDDRPPHIARLWHQNELYDSGTRLYCVQQTTCAEEIHAQRIP